MQSDPPRPDSSTEAFRPPIPAADRPEAGDDAGEEDAGDDGVDVTLILWSLSLTPQERINVLQANADALVRLQDAAASQR